MARAFSLILYCLFAFLLTAFPYYVHSSDSDIEVVHELITQGKLTEASNKIRQIVRSKSSNNDLLSLRTEIMQKKRLARSLYSDAYRLVGEREECQVNEEILDQCKNRGEKYCQSWATAQPECQKTILAYLDKALMHWSDNELIKFERKEIMQCKIRFAFCDGRPKFDQLGTPCIERLSGYGRRTQGQCYDRIDNINGPLLVVIPKREEIQSAYAITKYEISIQDYNNYCNLSAECLARQDDSSNPLTQISIDEAKAYATWLTIETSYIYSIPTYDQWVHAASSGGKEKDTKDKTANCSSSSSDKIVGKPNIINSIDTGKQSRWGLVHQVGNVQEWVTDENGSLYAAGGHHLDNIKDCSIDFKRKHDGKPDADTGFRLIREVEYWR